MEFRLQREPERGNDPARTGAAAHGWFRVHLRDKCGDRTEKMTLDAIKMAGNAQERREKEGRAVFTALRSVRAGARGARVKFCSNHAIFTWC